MSDPYIYRMNVGDWLLNLQDGKVLFVKAVHRGEEWLQIENEDLDTADKIQILTEALDELRHEQLTIQLAGIEPKAGSK